MYSISVKSISTVHVETNDEIIYMFFFWEIIEEKHKFRSIYTSAVNAFFAISFILVFKVTKITEMSRVESAMNCCCCCNYFLLHLIVSRNQAQQNTHTEIEFAAAKRARSSSLMCCLLSQNSMISSSRVHDPYRYQTSRAPRRLAPPRSPSAAARWAVSNVQRLSYRSRQSSTRLAPQDRAEIPSDRFARRASALLAKVC